MDALRKDEVALPDIGQDNFEPQFPQWPLMCQEEENLLPAGKKVFRALQETVVTKASDAKYFVVVEMLDEYDFANMEREAPVALHQPGHANKGPAGFAFADNKSRLVFYTKHQPMHKRMWLCGKGDGPSLAMC